MRASLLFLALAAAGTAQVPPSSPRGRLAYTRCVDGAWQIWEADPDSGATRRLSAGGPDAAFAAVRADGAVSWCNANQEAFVREAGSEAPKAFLRALWPVRDVTWSADGKRVAFTRIRTDLVDAMNLWVADADGANARMVTSEPGVQWQGALAPAGDRIAFSAGKGFASYEICVAGIDGTGYRKLTDNRNLDFHPAWSPDGRQIAWSSDATGDYEIWVMFADGSNQRQLTRSAGLDGRPAWSPDGSRIAFTSSRGGTLGIWTMEASGGDVRRAERLGDDVRDPAWAPARADAAGADSAAERSADPPAAAAASPPAAPPFFDGVGVEPKSFIPGSGGPATVRFTIPRPASVVVDLADRRGVLVRRLDLGPAEAGAVVAAWDGRDFMGRPVGPGVYRYLIRAEEDSGRVHRFDAPGTGGEELSPRDFTYDPSTGRLAWLMPRAGLAWLRIGIQGFPHLVTLLEWKPLAAGRQEYVWDGKDASGHVDLRKHPELSIVLSLWALPDNTVIADGPGLPDGGIRADASYPEMVSREPAYLHARHAPGSCREYRFAVEVSGDGGTDAEGRPVASGIVPVRVRLDPRDRAQLLDVRYEIAVYVDLTFLFEEEEGVDPFTFHWDTTALPPGEHLLTVNVIGYDDHLGVVTQRVMVAPPK